VRGRGYVAAAPPVNRQSRIPPPCLPKRGKTSLTTNQLSLRERPHFTTLQNLRDKSDSKPLAGGNLFNAADYHTRRSN